MDSKARQRIIFDFFDLLAALAAHGKTNGLSGYKLSRYAGWWAFEHYDTGKGFDTGYKAWNIAADATCHLFFAYLRSSSPEPGMTNGILDLPRSLQQLVATTTYPPSSGLLANDTTKVVMVVDIVSPTPYALLRRAKNFEYRDDDRALQQFSDHEDPVDALTDECRRVLRAISTTNQSNVSDSKTSTSLVDPSWSRFEDIGFGSALDDINEDEKAGLFSFSVSTSQGVNSAGRSPVLDLNRPTTPSWADFLSSGFTDENGNRSTAPMLISPDKMLPPINAELRGQSSQSHKRHLESSSALEPGELASITKVDVDDSFWWVWISSLAGEEPTSRKACFGRCAFVETTIPGGRWMILEEQVKGAAPEPVQGAYIAEKKSFLGFTKRGRLSRRRSGIKKSPLSPTTAANPELNTVNHATLDPDQQVRIQKAALELSNKKKAEETAQNTHNRRGRFEDSESRANSIFTLGPQIKDEASPALQWARQYDKNTIRAHYLGNQLAGTGSSGFLTLPTNGLPTNQSTSTLSESVKEKELPTVPQDQVNHDLEPVLNSTATTAIPIEREEKQAIEAGSAPASAPEMELLSSAALVKPTAPSETQITPSTERVSLEAATVALPVTAAEIEKVDVSPRAKQGPVAVRPPSAMGSNQTKPSSPEHVRRTSLQGDPSTVPRTNGIKRLFGTIRKNREESAAAPPPAPRANPAVAAARRALESKLNPQEPVPVQNNFAKYKVAKSPILDTKAPVPPPKTERVPELQPSPLPATKVPEDATLEPTALETRTVEAPVPFAKDPKPVTHDVEQTIEPEELMYQPPRTRRDEEFDNLSRVDTREREHADREFSRFDQGPLLDQPAAVPIDYTRRDVDVTENHNDYAGRNDDVAENHSGYTHHDIGSSEHHDHQDKHQSIYSAVTMPADDTDTDEDDETTEESELTQEVSANDRWAQIRRNAAERAARFSEDDNKRSRTDTRNDDGDTSGEESKSCVPTHCIWLTETIAIESRVARIKARVAELTGNMEGIRR